MELKVLGCSGGIGGLDQRTTSLRVDRDILIDCGTGAGILSVDELVGIDHVFLTHAHLDHIALLPLLVDTVGDLRERPITLYATDATLKLIRSHIFNWLIWPDFTAIPDRVNPYLRMQPLRVGEAVELGGRRITAIPALHSVPAVGYWLQAEGGSLVFSGDTTISESMIEAVNRIHDLRYLLIETAFSNSQQDLAMAARHLCPSMLHRLLDRLTGDPEVYVTHLKPGFVERTAEEVLAYTGRLRPRILANDQVFRI
ncbi:MAG: 3',5'-cyclic-nucleotide phosphodiesterase [Moraxellaceae bacterium]|nr:3',5'-cyclic-nucleotide phosphodiesterase [Moraxellaceae bacterium]